MIGSNAVELNDNYAFRNRPFEARTRSRDYQSTPRADEMLLVVVGWSIVKGREEEFLSYWSEKEAISDRAGLIGEFLNRVRDDEALPDTTWERDSACSTFLNIGMWRSHAAYQAQIGDKIMGGTKRLPFEHAPRQRLFLGPERWRLGGSLLPVKEHAAVR